MKFLVLNAGSSSLKAMLCEAEDPLPSRPVQPLWSATAQWGREAGRASLHVETAAGASDQYVAFESPKQLACDVLRTLVGASVIASGSALAAVGHRIVHGGKLRESTIISAEV